MNRYYYKIADIVIRVNYNFEYDYSMSYIYDFIVDECPYDYDFYFEKVDNIKEYVKDNMKEVKRVGNYMYYVDNDNQEYCFHIIDDIIYGITVINDGVGYCYYVDENILAYEVNHGYYLENYLCLENILIKYDAMILHSCHIDYNDQAILFSAPSGTGKSTQGNLWKDNFSARVINGDRTIIRKVENQWIAYGAPFCGTSGININHSEALSTIIVIRQFKENNVLRIPAFDAIKLLYSELTIHSWNQNYVNSTFDWLMMLINDVPVYLYQCTKENDAALYLKAFLESEGVIHD